nr:retrovirus-related Pol polyprotein from transposon TNT 1-94 [Tanacetum cinerariifolium]
MESSSDSNQEINANMVFMAQIEKVLSDSEASSSSADEKISEVSYYLSESESESEFETSEYYNNSTNYGLFVNNDDDQEIFHDAIDSANNLYNGRKGIGFENPSYFEKAKDLRPTLYDEKVIGLGYTPMFLTYSDEALEIEKFKRSRENKIEFAYDYGNLNVSYVNEKINLEDDYYQGIINLDFDKIDSLFQQTSLLKPYVPNVILEKITIDLEDEVNENDCHKIEKVCDKEGNPKVIAPGMFKLNVSQCVSPISMSKSSCDSNNVEIKLKRKRHLDTFSSVRRPKNSGVDWKKKRVHMTGNRALLTNFVEKFLGTVRFGNNDFAVIAGYRYVVIGSMTIKKVYYVEGLGHNIFSIRQFCNKGLEVAFRKSTCFVRNEDGVDLLIGDRSSNLYTIALNEVASHSSTYLLAKASSSQSWLWHQRLSHLNFATINNLVKNNLVQGLPKIKFEKDHLCSACEQGKIHQKHHKSKMDFASNKPLYLLHMDLCGPMRIQSINGKRYVLVVVDDYSRYI